jgi:hypothetical protein
MPCTGIDHSFSTAYGSANILIIPMLARSSRFGTFLANSEKQKNDENFYTGSVRTEFIFLLPSQTPVSSY